MFEVFTKPAIDGKTVFDHMKQVGDAAAVFAEFTLYPYSANRC